MDERELYAAYSRSANVVVPPDVCSEADVRNHSTKCVWKECPVLIAYWAGRSFCRWHERMIREAR